MNYMTRAQITDGGALYFHFAEGPAAATLLALPAQAISGVVIMTDGPALPGPLRLTNLPAPLLAESPEDAIWESWDGVSSVNPAISAVSIPALPASARVCITVRTWET